MENLPSLCFEYIFQYLTIKERVKCSLVCKNWRLAYYLFETSDLCVYEEYFKMRKSILTNQLIKFENSLEENQFFAFEITKKLFKNLKKLILLGLRSDIKFSSFKCDFPFENIIHHLNNFINLEHLEIEYVRFLSEKSQKLSLPNLKVLIFRNSYFQCSEIEVDCPKLEILMTDVNFGKINCTNSLKFLDYTYTSTISDSGIYRLGNKFENLEIIILDTNNKLISVEFLNDFPKLKLLIVFTENDWIIRKLNLLKLNNSFELKIFKRMKVINFQPIFDLPNHLTYIRTLIMEANEEQNPKNWMKYLMNLSKSPKIVKYSVVSILNKTYRIMSIYLNFKIDDYMSLIEFIKKIGFLESFEIFFFDLDQKFYDMLPESLSVASMVFYESIFETNIKLDFLSKLDVYEIICCTSPCFYNVRFNDHMRSFYSFLRIILSNNRLQFFGCDDIVPEFAIKREKNGFKVNYFYQNLKPDTIYNEINEVLKVYDDQVVIEMKERFKEEYLLEEELKIRLKQHLSCKRLNL